MTGQPTRLEASAGSVVLAYCVACPSWRELATDQGEAYRAAAQHLQAVHGLERAANKRRQQAARHAE